MIIKDARIKVSFSTEEKRALRTVRDILEKLDVKNPMAFLTAYSDRDWVYYDDETAFEFLDNTELEEEEEE